MTFRFRLLGAVLALAAIAAAVDAPDVGGHGPSQEAADALRSFASTDGAFLAAGLVKEGFDKENLASLLTYPTDEVVVVNLTGAQIKQAFELSIKLLPQPNQSFLQISGFEVVFNKTARPGARIVRVTAGASALEDGKSYSIAMPSSLARGGLGYFRLWDKSKIAKTFEGKTVEDVLRNKRSSGSASRWSAQPPPTQ